MSIAYETVVPSPEGEGGGALGVNLTPPPSGTVDVQLLWSNYEEMFN